MEERRDEELVKERDKIEEIGWRRDSMGWGEGGKGGSLLWS